MQAYCTPCGRPFKAQADLDQHLRKSTAHKKSTKTPAKPQPVEQVKQPLPVVKPVKPIIPSSHPPQKQSQRPAPHFAVVASQIQPIKQAGSDLALASSSRTFPTTNQAKHTQPLKPTSSKPLPSEGTNLAITTATAAPDMERCWSIIPESEYTAVFEAISVHCHSAIELQNNGYITRPHNPQDYVNSRRCNRCKCQERDIPKFHGRECTFHPKKRNKWNPNRPYKCCKTDGKGCMTLPTHDFQLPLRAAKHKDYLQTPASSPEETKLRAVTIDCEMAGVTGGSGEAILLCVTDYITGAVLINRYIFPNEKITQMRTSIHGIFRSTLDAAILQGQALIGWEGARRELWKYIDADTILVGHALENELNALRMIHLRIVDSGILSRNAVGISRIRWGLKTLCSELLKREIRKNKGGIHDCLEDVHATREVVLFCTRKQDEFQSWAKAKKIEELRLEKEREKMRQRKKELQARQDMLEDRDEEVLHWSDIAEDLGWPHPDTGYDPWSD